MSRHFLNELDRLKRKLLHQGAVVEKSIADSISSLLNRDPETARKIIAQDTEVNDLEIEIEEDCLKILALHQPVAIDLRFITMCMKINVGLERMADRAVNISERVVFLSSRPPIEIPPQFDLMSGLVKRMVKGALDSLVNRDQTLARAVCADDDEIDQYNREIYSLIKKTMRGDPERLEEYLSLCTTSSNLERIADLSRNIAEDVVYMVSGEIIRHQQHEPNPPKSFG